MVAWGFGRFGEIGGANANGHGGTDGRGAGGLHRGDDDASEILAGQHDALPAWALAVTEGNFIAHGNLGSVLEDDGKLDEAEKEFIWRKSRLKPKNSKTLQRSG